MNLIRAEISFFCIHYLKLALLSSEEEMSLRRCVYLLDSIEKKMWWLTPEIRGGFWSFLSAPAPLQPSTTITVNAAAAAAKTEKPQNTTAIVVNAAVKDEPGLTPPYAIANEILRDDYPKTPEDVLEELRGLAKNKRPITLGMIKSYRRFLHEGNDSERFIWDLLLIKQYWNTHKIRIIYDENLNDKEKEAIKWARPPAKTNEEITDIMIECDRIIQMVKKVYVNDPSFSAWVAFLQGMFIRYGYHTEEWNFIKEEQELRKSFIDYQETYQKWLEKGPPFEDQTRDSLLTLHRSCINDLLQKIKETKENLQKHYGEEHDVCDFFNDEVANLAEKYVKLNKAAEKP